jgi:hypothetical protein
MSLCKLPNNECRLFFVTLITVPPLFNPAVQWLALLRVAEGHHLPRV